MPSEQSRPQILPESLNLSSKAKNPEKKAIISKPTPLLLLKLGVLWNFSGACKSTTPHLFSVAERRPWRFA
jgi:hypothetical protein